ncbi:hypothetical protein HK100_005175 [Physocladia obscura]|uniref:Uncharacterized protein n=1 Tax=Physocladia obscura TaxID=109957 RepID=A0AAD5T6N9_9FUNG|nr:hypothetical protein HK100_005175 [Physocladia obscura]
MLTGRYPFEFPEDGNLLGLYEKIVSGGFEMPEELDPDLENLIQGKEKKSNIAHSGLLDRDAISRFSIHDIQKHPWYLAFFQENLKPQAPILSYPSTDFSAPEALGLISLSRTTAATQKESVITASINVSTGSSNSSREGALSSTAAAAAKKAKYRSIISLHIKETPCETTMIPFLTELCGKEITDEIAVMRRFMDMIGREDIFDEQIIQKEDLCVSTGRMLGIKKNSISMMGGKEETLDLKGLDVRKNKKSIKVFFKGLFRSKDSSVKPLK